MPFVNIKPLSLNLGDEQLKRGLAASPDKPAQLRVVVQDNSSGAAGSVRIPLSPR